MSPLNRITATILCIALSSAAMAAAEEAAATPKATVPASSGSHLPLRQWTAHQALNPSTTRPSRGAHGALIGALVGAAAATGAVAVMAQSYGNNEGGGFCGLCFAQWGAFAIPVGTLSGAAIGYGIAKATSPQYASPVPRTFVAPVVGRRGGGLLMTVRY